METNQDKQGSITAKRTTLRAFNNQFRQADIFESCPICEGDEDTATQLLIDCYVEMVRECGGEMRKSNLSSKVVRFAAGHGKPWLLLTGAPGTGKTTLMKAIHRLSLCDRPSEERTRIKWVKASAMGGILKNEPQEWEKLKSARLLFIDDIGFTGEREVVNDYGVTAFPFVELVEHRYDYRLATVVSTNLSPARLSSMYGQKIADRLFETCEVVEVNGTNFRRP